ncbi:alpha/beta-hydrolase [Xylaria acuta]|nr:alpha/beta-hydrolase [Xylaria acuta]
MAAEIEEPVVAGDSSATAEEVKPYRIHVSSRYLNLTKQKLEIARLPHEFDEPKSKDWWQPKSQVEPLIDFWLEQYQWRDHEEILNRLPQFRTGFAIPQSDSPIRIQFIHVRSSHANVIPLLLIPPFPFSSLSVGHLVKLFTDPEEVNHQPFHLVIPSLPGLGFSDALPTNSPVISSTADLLDSLMKRLDYSHYLVTNAGAGVLSPAQIDYKLADWLATQYPDSCLGTHLISPPLTRPRARQAPLGWAKWSIARFFEGSVLGYRTEDYSALRKSGGAVAPSKKSTITLSAALGFGFSGTGLTEPNTLSYALCDSPTGLLVFAMKGLRLLAPKKEFSPTEIINFTQLAWLPGPEAALRFWAHCARHPENSENSGSGKKKSARKPRVALTVFLGDEKGGDSSSNSGNAEIVFDNGMKPPYSCPAWAGARYDVLYTHRAAGDAGLLAWECPELIAAGVRGLAAAVLRVDRRLQPEGRPETARAAAVAETSAAPATATSPEVQEQKQQQQQQQQQPPSPPGLSSEQQPPLGLGLLAPPKIGERLLPVREISEDTKVASSDSLAAAKTPSPMPATPSPVHSGPPQPATVAVGGVLNGGRRG